MNRFMLLWLVAVLSSVQSQDLIIAYNESYSPFSYLEEGKVVGIEIDIIDELATRAGLRAVHKAVPWARAQLMVKDGQADGFVTVANAEREGYAVMSTQGVFSLTITAATAKDNPRLIQLQGIKDVEGANLFPQVNYLGTSLSATLLKDAKVSYVSSLTQIFNLLLLHRADIFIESNINILYNASKLKMADKIEILPVKFSSVILRLGLSKRSPLVEKMPELNEVLKIMTTDGTIEAIFRRWGVSSITP